jgi:uncharacterized membrane protein YjjB (DUF3815 family)
MKKRILTICIPACLLLIPAIAAACPGCNSALGNEAGRGFNTSIAFMMSMPFLVVGSIAVGVFFSLKKRPKKKN